MLQLRFEDTLTAKINTLGIEEGRVKGSDLKKVSGKMTLRETHVPHYAVSYYDKGGHNASATKRPVLSLTKRDHDYSHNRPIESFPWASEIRDIYM